MCPYFKIPPQGIDAGGRRWVALFEGDFSEAKPIIRRLEAKDVPNRLVFPRDRATSFTVKIEVMRHWLPEAQGLLAP
jgi:hypothetical protein